MPLPRARRSHLRRVPLPLVERPPERDVCLELSDHSVVQQSAVQFFGLQASRDPHPQAARLSEQFTKQNRSLFSLLDVQTETYFDGNDLLLRLISSDRVGAVPLFSPNTWNSGLWAGCSAAVSLARDWADARRYGMEDRSIAVEITPPATL